MSVFGLRWCGWCRWGVGGCSAWDRVWKGGWFHVSVSLDYLRRWQVQVSVYCARRLSAHLSCTQCSMLLYLLDICFLSCICLW